MSEPIKIKPGFHPDLPGGAQSDHSQVMSFLSRELRGLLQSIPVRSQIIYLDIPLYFNVGDLLINLGAELFLSRSSIDVVARLSFFDLCTVDWSQPDRVTLKTAAVAQLRSLDRSAIIVLQGGGNLGDLYPDLQAMRESIIRTFPERRIVMLPQSLHFRDERQQQSALERMTDHPDIHLYLRDRPSLEAVRAVSPHHGALMPDMAHALWDELAPARARAPRKDFLYMLRRDQETTNVSPDPRTSIDWEDLIRPSEKLAWRLMRKAMAKDLDPKYNRVVWLWYRLRDRLVRRSVDLFADHHCIKTDRLHGLILGCLLARRVVRADNSYGKLTRYSDQWLSSSPLIEAEGSL